MLSFTGASAYHILLGTKTQTRRVWKRPHVKIGNIYWATTNRYVRRARFARLEVVNLREWDGKDIDLEDARREGFVTVSEFWVGYTSLNTEALKDPTRTQYIIDFKVVEKLKTPEFLLEEGN